MECCGTCCGEEDREYWMNDRISPKIGLSDDDLLDFQSDDADVSATPVVHHVHRSRVVRRRGGSTAAEASTRIARGHKQSIKTFDRSESREQDGRASVSRQKSHGQGPPVSLKSRQSMQASRPPSSAQADAPHTAPEASQVGGSAPPKLTALSAEEKEEEKKRLQLLVKEFAREAVLGFDVQYVNVKSGTRSAGRFTMDRFLTGIEIKCTDTEGTSPVCAKMQDVTGIFKGDAAAARCSDVIRSADKRQLLVIETSDNQSTVILAENQPKRDKIYTCLKILSNSKGLQTRQQIQQSAQQMLQKVPPSTMQAR